MQNRHTKNHDFTREAATSVKGHFFDLIDYGLDYGGGSC
jgi:hypothetical protein